MKPPAVGYIDVWYSELIYFEIYIFMLSCSDVAINADLFKPFR